MRTNPSQDIYSSLLNENILGALAKAPEKITISDALATISRIQQINTNPTVLQGIIGLQTKLIHLQKEGDTWVTGALETMLHNLIRNSLPTVELTRILTTTPAVNDEKFEMAA